MWWNDPPEKEPHSAATTFLVGLLSGFVLGIIFPVAFLGWQPF